MVNKEKQNDGRKDSEFGHGGMSEEEKRRAREKGGERSQSGGRNRNTENR